MTQDSTASSPKESHGAAIGGRRGLRLGALATAAAGVFVVSAAVSQPVTLDGRAEDSGESAVQRTDQQVPIGAAALWCPGPEQQGLAEATVSEVDQRVTVRAMAPPRAALGAEFGEPAAGELTLRAEGAAVRASDERGRYVEQQISTADPGELLATGGLAAGVAGAQLWLGDQEQRAGLALTGCGPALDSAWLLAGGQETGRAERLVLINPGRAPISVEVQVLGDGRSAVAAADSEIALEPGERRIVLLDALAPGAVAPAVQVSATGGPVTAYLGDRWLEGTTDLGWELSGPTGDPATTHVLAGVRATEAAPTVLRVAVPGAESAVVQLRALTDEGSVDLPTDVTLLPGEQSTDIEIDDLPSGTSGLVVDSDEPVVVSAQLSTSASTQGRMDIAWAPSSSPIEGLAGTVLPQPGDEESPAVGYRLHVVSPEGAAVTVYRTGPDGEVSSDELEVAPGAATQLALSAADGVWVEAEEGQAYAAVTAGSVVSVVDEDPTADAADRADADADDDEVSMIAVLALSDLPRYRSLVDVVPQR